MAVNQEAEKPDDEDEFVDELTPGTKLLQGQYTITKFINSGGFGITYLAKDSLDRDVVIKECFPSAFCRRSNTIVGARSRAHQSEFKSIVKLFVQEAKSQSKLIHPNIVGVHQVFEDNDTAYMALDFINGRDLLEIIDDEKVTLTPDSVVSMLRKLLGAVSFIHERGVLHRDISPDNILVNQTGEPILIDFGAAREQASTKSRALSALRVVKDGYSPQEFYIAGSSQNDSSDLYALAATFYHVITGEAPPNSQARLAAIAEDSSDLYDPLDGRFEGYPPNFLKALDKAISVLPKDRIKSAKDWQDIIDGKVSDDNKPVEASIARLLADEKTGKAPAKPAASTAPAKPAASASPQVKAVLAPEKKKSKMGLLLGSAAVVAVIAGLTAFQFTPSDTAEPTVNATPIVETPTEPVTSATVTAEPTTPVEEPIVIVETVEEPVVEQPTEAPVEAITEETPVTEDPAVAEEEALAAVDEPIVVEEPAVVEEQPSDEIAEVVAGQVAESLEPEEPTVSVAEETPVVEETPVEEAVQTEEIAQAEPEPTPEIVFGRPVVEEPSNLLQREAGISIAEDQFETTDWNVTIPFETRQGQTEGGEFPVISSVAAAAQAIPQGEWLAEDIIIYAVNGEWVSDGVTISDILLQSPDLGQDQFVYADVRMKLTAESQFEHNTLAVPVSRTLELKNGVSMNVDFIDGQWRTSVTSVDDETMTDLRPGDVLVAEASTGRELTTSQSLEFLLRRFARDQIAQADFTINRNGLESDAKMLLAEGS